MFETKDGCRAIKSEYRYPNGGHECVLLASGEYAHFAQHIKDPKEQAQAHNATMVRLLAVVSSAHPVTSDGTETASLRATIVVKERLAVGALDGGDSETFVRADNEVTDLRGDLYRFKNLD